MPTLAPNKGFGLIQDNDGYWYVIPADLRLAAAIDMVNDSLNDTRTRLALPG